MTVTIATRYESGRWIATLANEYGDEGDLFPEATRARALARAIAVLVASEAVTAIVFADPDFRRRPWSPPPYVVRRHAEAVRE